MSVASSHEPSRQAVASLDLDWRFLLPPSADMQYARLLLLGGDRATAAKVEAAGVAREVALAPDGRRADAVACLAGAGLRLEEAASHVGTGGVLYYESNAGRRVRVRTSPTRLLRTLRRLNLTPTGLYWVHPSFTGPRTYFPLDVTGALRWYLHNLHSSAVPIAGVDRALDRLARISPTGLGRVAPRLAVFAVERRPEDVSSVALPVAELPPLLRRPDVRPLLLIHGTDLTHAVMLPFSSSSSEPLAVLKIRRGDDGSTPQAQAVLEKVRKSVDRPLRATLPEPLGTVRSNGITASVESFVPGQWMRARLARRRLPLNEAIEDLELATDWIGDLHSRFPFETRSWGDDENRTCVDEPIEAFTRALGSTPAEADLFAELGRRADELRGTPLPIVWRHGDFSSLNVLRSGRRIHVVDWEMAGPGLPLDDVLHFTRLWLYLVRKADRPATFLAFCDLFLRPQYHDRLVDAGRAAIAHYVRRLELDPRFVPLLLVAGCVRRAIARMSGRPSEPRERNRYATYLGLIAEHAPEPFVWAETWRAG